MLKKFSGLVRTILYGKQYPFNAKSMILGDEEFLLREIIDQDIKELIAQAIEKYAPAGTQVRCCFVDDNRGFFFTVEPFLYRKI